jgi:hypothetical protein
MEYMADKVALKQVAVRILLFSPVSIFPSMLHSRISLLYHSCYVTLATVSVVK